MTELQLGKYEFYPNEEYDDDKEKLLREMFPFGEDETAEGHEQRKIEDKFIDAARKYLAEKEEKRKKRKLSKKSHRR